MQHKDLVKSHPRQNGLDVMVNLILQPLLERISHNIQQGFRTIPNSLPTVPYLQPFEENVAH